jgi:cytochrome c-type biogenesis protein CcmH
VLRERRRELDAALAHLPPDAPDRRAALAEFAAQADAELAAAGTPAAGAQPGVRRPLAAVVLALLMAVPTFGLYLMAGAPEAASPELRSAREPANLDELVADLRARLAQEPDRLDGWRLLGRAELARGNAAGAREAFERAAALAPNDAQSKVDLADATAQAQGAVLEGRPIELIREALALDPKNPKALALAGAYEVHRGDPKAAIGFWKRLLEVLPADSDQAKQVAGFVADLEAGRPPQVARSEADGAGGAASGPGPSPGPVGGATAPGAAAGMGAPAAEGAAAAAVRGRIDVDRRLADRLRTADTLFVVARTIDDAGKPVGPPVAVMRASGADLPLEFSLDDAMSMSPAARLSALGPDARVVVIARLSRTGEAASRSGDLQGASAPVKPGASGVRVLIDTVVD